MSTKADAAWNQRCYADVEWEGQTGDRRDEMNWAFLVALVVAIPIVLFPAALVWYLNIGGIGAAVRRARARRARGALEREEKTVVKT